jgi:hypothetical protein
MNGNADDILDEAQDTVDRLRDFQVREPTIHIPTREERRQAEIEADEEERRREALQMRQQEREAADAAEVAAVEAQVEHEAGWEEWLATRLAAERTALLEALADEFTAAVTKLRAEFEEQISGVQKQVERERTARQHTRDATHERIQGMTQSHDREVAVLKERITSLQREVDSLREQQGERDKQAAQNNETQQSIAAMTRYIFEECLLRR